MSHRHGDIIKAFEQGGALAWVDREGKDLAVGTDDRIAHQIDLERLATIDVNDALLKLCP